MKCLTWLDSAFVIAVIAVLTCTLLIFARIAPKQTRKLAAKNNVKLIYLSGIPTYVNDFNEWYPTRQVIRERNK